MLDFEALSDDTLDPAPNKGEAKQQRFATLSHLKELGITNEIIARTCRVEPQAVANWHRRSAGPGGHIARRALDRLAPILSYMSDELGLNDYHIAKFLLEEPRVPKEEQRDWTYDKWYPEQQAYEESPIITAIGVHDGPAVFGQRIAQRFAERQVEEQAGILASPETVV